MGQDHDAYVDFFNQVGKTGKDLTQRLPDDSELARSVNQFQDNIQASMEALLKAVILASASSFKLESQMGKAAADLEHQGTNIQKIAQESKINASDMVQLAEKTAQIRDSARFTQEASHRGQQGLSQLHSCLDGLSQNQKKTNLFLQELQTATNILSSLLTSIAEISDGLKVIAINSAIESARAGAAGKGFGVLAKEIQSVALRTSQASQEAEKLVSSLREKTQAVGEGVEESQSLTSDAGTLGSQVVKELQTAHQLNKELEEGASGLNQRLNEQKDFALSMAQAAEGLSLSKDSIVHRVGQTNQLAENLHKSVQEGLIHAGDVKLGWHKTCLDEFTRLYKECLGRTVAWEAFLAPRIDHYKGFAMVYVLDQGGIQLCDNVVTLKNRDKIESTGKGMDRREKTYYREAQGRTSPWISGIYISSATQDLCVTVSQKLPTGEVLAVDLSLSDLISLEKS